MSEYRPVRVADDELVHYGALGIRLTIACEQVVVGEWDEPVPIEQPRCGKCSVKWLAATGQIRLVRRMRTIVPPELAAPRRPVDP